MPYTPRRARARWREGAPAYVIDCFDSRGPGERYTVFCGSYAATPSGVFLERGEFRDTYVQFLGMSGAPSHPQGVSMWGEMSASDAARYRYREGKRRVRWLDLPEVIRRHVVARCAAE